MGCRHVQEAVGGDGGGGGGGRGWAPVEDSKQETGGGNGSCKGRVLAEKEEPGDGSGSTEGRGGCAEEEVGVGAKEVGAAALGTRGVEVSGKGDKVGGGLLGCFDGISFQLKAYWFSFFFLFF